MSSTVFSTAQRIHFIGVGGIGMSALARLFVHDGKRISGSDRTPSEITASLKEEGVTVLSPQVASNITHDIELVVYTEAMAPEHEEMVAARALGVPMMNYFEALGMVANEYYLIAVAGAHGKTTTTAMLIDILEEAGLDPTAIVGSLRAKTGSNFRPGKSKYAIVEACEYKNDFQHLAPDVLVITNIDYEHVDYYKNLGEVQQAFRALAEKVPVEGAVIANTAHPNVAPVVAGLNCRVVGYRSFLDLELPLKQPGLHNRENAAAASAAADFLGIDRATIKNALVHFSGTWRRFEYKGTVNGAPVYDDYAHHPRELAACLAGARELYPAARIIMLFQPHTYSRTVALYDDFVTELNKADEVILLPIYAAREENTTGITSEKIAEAVGAKARVVPGVHEAMAALQLSANPHDVVLVVGAGDVTRVAELLTM